MNFVIRENCVICNNSILQAKIFYEFKSFPMSMSVCTEQNVVDEMDMKWYICEYCGCIQLKELVRLDYLYSNNHNSSIGKTWKNHHEEFCNFIVKKVKENAKILELGGGNIFLSNLVCNYEKIQNYDIVDVSCGKYDTQPKFQKINLYQLDFESFSFKKRMYDCVVHSHTFEHLYDPKKTLKKIYRSLNDDGLMIFSIPNLINQIRDLHLNALSFEHNFLYSDYSLRFLLNNCGFEIVEKIKFSEWNDFYVCKKKNVENTKPTFDYFPKIFFQKFIKELKEDVNKINRLIYNKDVFIFGAHVNTQYMFNLGLEGYSSITILDNDIKKHDHVLPGTINSVVKNPNSIFKLKNPLVILRISQYNEEVKQELLSNNPTIIFI